MVYPLVVSEMQAMLRVLVLIVLIFRTEICVAKAVPELRRAFEAIETQDWTDALDIAKSNGPLAEDLVLWHYLRQGKGSFQQTARFVHQHPDWPGLKLLRKQSEPAFARANPADVAAFFEAAPPPNGHRRADLCQSAYKSETRPIRPESGRHRLAHAQAKRQRRIVVHGAAQKSAATSS